MSSPKLDDEKGRTYRGAGPQQRQDERRTKLIEAAYELFGTIGYRSSTVEKICATAGLTKRYFYESFDSSESLLVATYVYTTDRLRERAVSGTASATTLDDALHHMLGGFFGAIADDPRLARITFFEILGVSPEVDRTYRRVTETFVDTLIAMIGPSLGSTTVPDDQLRVIASGLAGALLMMAQHWILTDRPQPIETVVASAHLMVTAVIDRIGR
ncbi:TetR/AcrR family transcriptional regulator [Antrihabitans sp. YC2-6]|uniref:TetR/AcrR family transcriptional regulator n=1 Tax=Antrihabitans sp. YC2-6 TaxID=2799498 RepID=UPI0018F37AA0|nr:TetR/AcrR family transcriptional regulator [Antrihabitans sp. YC2-6]MBJ8346573.1 TetR/AcrR family transcriptional regulator [Antrihabitans sp. YC2-6]